MKINNCSPCSSGAQSQRAGQDTEVCSNATVCGDRTPALRQHWGHLIRAGMGEGGLGKAGTEVGNSLGCGTSVLKHKNAPANLDESVSRR